MVFNVEELGLIHGALVSRERILREDWIPAWGEDTQRGQELQKEADAIHRLRSVVCSAKISLELGIPLDAMLPT